MSNIQYTPNDYYAYLQMSNRLHLLFESREDTNTFNSRPNVLGYEPSTADYDIVGDLIWFAEPISNQEKLERIHDGTIGTPCADKVVVIDDLDYYVPQQDTATDVTCTPDAELLGHIQLTLKALETDSIVISSHEEVSDYISRHPDMLEVLLHVAKLTSEEFSNKGSLSVEVYNDPEIGDEYLTLYVRQEQYDDYILKQIDSIRERYEELLTHKSGWIVVTTDFEVPR